MIELKSRVRALEELVHDLASQLHQSRTGQPLPAPRALPQIGAGTSEGNGRDTPNRLTGPSGNGNGNGDEESVAAVLQQLSEGSPTGPGSGRGGLHSFEAELNALMAQLPSRKMCDTLIASFFSRVDWQIHVSAPLSTHATPSAQSDRGLTRFVVIRSCTHPCSTR